MSAPAYEVRPPRVEALQWTPDDIDTVGRVLTWLQFAGAEPAIERGRLSILCAEVDQERADVPAESWVVRDPQSREFRVYTADEFTAYYREVQP